MKELIKTLKLESYQYKDPITEFVLCLFSEYNFDRAHQMLVKCQEVMEADYFLSHWREAFVQNARQVIFEMYCRLHSAIDVKSLADKLSMEHDDAEKWIVDLVSSANLNARIDSAAGTVVMGPQHKAPMDIMMDSIRNLTVRCALRWLLLAQYSSRVSMLPATRASTPTKRGARRLGEEGGDDNLPPFLKYSYRDDFVHQTCLTPPLSPPTPSPACFFSFFESPADGAVRSLVLAFQAPPASLSQDVCGVGCSHCLGGAGHVMQPEGLLSCSSRVWCAPPASSERCIAGHICRQIERARYEEHANRYHGVPRVLDSMCHRFNTASGAQLCQKGSKIEPSERLEGPCELLHA